MAARKKSSLSPTTLMLFFENLGILLASGIALDDCLKLMAEDSRSERERRMIEAIRGKLGDSFYLHTALEELNVFPEYAVSMVRVGEHSGNLDQICQSLASYYEQENHRSAQIRGAIINPFILVCIMTVVIAFLVNAILPVFSSVYAQMGMDINENSMVQIALNVGQIAMYVMLVLMCVCLLGFIFYLTKPGKNFFAWVAQHSIFTRKFHRETDLARFTSTFGMLINSGAEVTVAMELSTNVCENTVIRNKLRECTRRMQAGEPLGVVLTESGIFNPSHNGIIRSAVRAGSTPRVMAKLADLYEDSTTRTLNAFLTVIEPLLIGILSLIIGVILICVMLPLIGILSSIG